MEQKSKKHVDQFGNIRWRLPDGDLHRLDGPAVEYVRGYKAWYINGNLHRLDGPAIEWADGDKEWYINGKLHRLDGPAIEFASGYKEWYVNGKCYPTFQTYLKAVKPLITEQEYYILLLTYGNEV